MPLEPRDSHRSRCFAAGISHTVDRLGAPRAAGGMCATLRDLALVGQLVANRGRRKGREVVPADWLADLLEGGDTAAGDAGDFAPYFPGMEAHYRSKWYVLRGDAPMAFGVGVFDQNVFADPENGIVIVKMSSQAPLLDERLIALTMRGVEAVRRHLAGG